MTGGISLWRSIASAIPADPDEGLAYYTGSWNPLTMITSSFAHGDGGHKLFNLVFFFAFAAAVEVLIGPIWFITFVFVDSWFIGPSGSMAAALMDQHYWTPGLSGIVMAHVMGGLGGYLFGLLFLREVRKDAEHTQDALDRLEAERRFR